MAIELATGYVSVVPSAKGFGSKLKDEIGGDLDSVGTDAGDRVSKGFLSRFTSNTGVKIGAALTAAFAGSKVADGISGAVNNASDLNETMSKVAQIFGTATPLVLGFAAGADKAFGQSKQQALDAAANFATFGKSAGLSGDELAGFSTGLVGVASDFASFFNTSPEDAIAAIGSALVGESEPIRKYGVLLDEATIQQRAMKLGLISTTKEALTPQQKVLARQAEIMAQLGDSQGDFARTADGAANKQRILSAEAKNASAEFGQALLPAYSAFLTLMAEHVLPTLTKVTIFLTEHKGVLIAVGIAIGTILVVALVAWAAAAVAAAAATLAAAAPVLLIAAAVAAFIAVMVILPIIVGRNLDKVLEFFANVFGKIGEFFTELPGRILSLLGSAGTWLLDIGKNIIQGLINGIQDALPQVISFFANLPGNILSWLGNLIGLLFGAGRDLLQGLLNGLNNLVGNVASFFGGLPGRILGWLGDLGGLLVGAGGALIQGLINGINSWIPSIAGNISGIPGRISTALGYLGDLLYGAGQAVIEGLLNGIRSMASAAAGAAKSVVQGAINAAKSVLGIGSPSRVFAAIGVNVSEGFVVGLQRSGGMVTSAVKSQFGVGPQRFSVAPLVSGLSQLQPASAGVGGGSTVNVYTQTNANPHQIAGELSWVLLTRGR